MPAASGRGPGNEPDSFTVQVEAVEWLQASRTGGLDAGRATGRVLEVLRSPKGAEGSRVRAGDTVSFRVPIWAWSERRREPPGPGRLYWGPDAPSERLDVWGAIRDEEFIASVFESKDARPRAGPGVSVAAALDRIDQLEAAFRDAHDRDLVASLERVAGLHLQPAASDETEHRADTPAADGWALAARLRLAGNSRILTVSLGDATCVRRSDVTARHGLDARLIPVSPHRTLPAPWHIEYAHHWGRMVSHSA